MNECPEEYMMETYTGIHYSDVDNNSSSSEVSDYNVLLEEDNPTIYEINR